MSGHNLNGITWASHWEARSWNLPLALIQSRVCPVILLLLTVLSSAAAAERRCLNISMVTLEASPYGDFTWRENCCIRQKWISPAGQPLDCSDTELSSGVLRIESYFNLCFPGISCQCWEEAFAMKIWILSVAWLFITHSSAQGLIS